MADEGKTLGQLVESLQQEYGEHHYGRVDLHISDELKNTAIARANSAIERNRRHEGASSGNAGRHKAISGKSRS